MRRALVVLLGVAIVVLAAGFLSPWLVSADAYRGEIARRAEAALGRPVAIGGPVRLALLPSPRLRASDLRIAGGADARAPEIAAKRIELELGWAALFGGSVTIARIHLIEPTVAVAGPEIWRHGFGAGPGGPIQIEEVVIEGGRLVWRDESGQVRHALDTVDARLTMAPESRTTRASGSAVADGIPVAFEATLGDAAADGRAPLSARLTLRPDLARATLRGTLARTKDGAAPEIRARVEIESVDAVAAVTAAGFAAPPDAFSGIARQPLSMAGELTWTDRRIAVDGLSLQLGDQRATGAAGLAYSRGRVLDVALAMGTLDLDRLAQRAQARAPARAARAGGAATTARVSGEPARRTLVLPDDLEGSFDLTIEALGLNGGTVRDVRATAALSRGTLVVSNAAALLPGGSEISGFGQIALGEAPAAIEGTLALQSDNLRGLLAWLGADTANVPPGRLRRIEGKGRVEGAPADLRFTGLDLRFDSTRVMGGIALRAGPRPALGLELRLDQLNLDDYLAAAPPASARAMLAGFDAHMRLRADSLILAGATIDGAALEGTLQNGSLDLRRLEIGAIGGATIAASGRIERLAERAAASLDVDVQAANAAGLFRLLDIPLQGDAALALAGRLQAEEGSGAKLDFHQLDLGALHARGRLEVAGGPMAPTMLELASDALPLEVLLGAPAASAGLLRIEAARLRLRLNQGALADATLSGAALGGALELTARPAAGRDTLAVALSVANADLKQASAALLGGAALVGRATLRARLAVPARGVFATRAAITGEIELEGAEGMIDGLDLGAMRQVLDNEASPADIVALLGAGLNSGATAYRQLKAAGRLEAGALHVDALRFETEFGPLEARVTADFERAALDAELRVPVAADPTAPKLRIALSGGLEAPRLTLDFTRLQSYLARRNAARAQPSSPR